MTATDPWVRLARAWSPTRRRPPPATGFAYDAQIRGRLVDRLYSRSDKYGGNAMALVRAEGTGREFTAMIPRFTEPERVMHRPNGSPLDLDGEILFLPRRDDPRRSPWWIIVHAILNPDGAEVLPFRPTLQSEIRRRRNDPRG